MVSGIQQSKTKQKQAYQDIVSRIWYKQREPRFPELRRQSSLCMGRPRQLEFVGQSIGEERAAERAPEFLTGYT